MWLLALLSIVLGLVVAIFDANIFGMAPLVWFVLAIAFAVVSPGPLPFVAVKKQQA